MLEFVTLNKCPAKYRSKKDNLAIQINSKISFAKFTILGTQTYENIFCKNIFPSCTLKFEGNKCGRVKLIGRVFCRVLKNVGKVRLNKIGLKFSRGKMLVTCEKLILFSLTFFPPIKYALSLSSR